MPSAIAELAILSLSDETAIYVLADAVQEAEWFDPRVMQVLWPLGRAKRNGERSMSGKQRRALDRAAWKAGFREFFWSFASKPTVPWARAIAAVAIFGSWQKGRWAMPARCSNVFTWTNVSVTIGGMCLTDVSNISYRPRRTP